MNTNSISNPISNGRQTEILLAKVLLFGLKISLFIVTVGGFLFLKQHGAEEPPAYAMLIGQINPIKISTILDGLRQGDGIAFIELGLFLLVATPVMRVGASIYAFAIRKDATYALIASTVLVILIAGLFSTPR